MIAGGRKGGGAPWCEDHLELYTGPELPQLPFAEYFWHWHGGDCPLAVVDACPTIAAQATLYTGCQAHVDGQPVCDLEPGQSTDLPAPGGATSRLTLLRAEFVLVLDLDCSEVWPQTWLDGDLAIHIAGG